MPRSSREAQRRRARHVIRLFNAGHTVEEIAQARRLRRRTVKRILAAAGIADVDESIREERMIDMTDKRERDIQELWELAARPENTWILELMEKERAVFERKTEELREKIEDLQVQLGMDTVESAEERIEAFVKANPGVSYAAAFDFVANEVSEKEAARRAREEKRRREKQERNEEQITDAKVRRHAEANDLSYEDAIIELTERVDQGEVI